MNRSDAPLDLLVTLWEGGGNVPPTLAVVRRLVERGHRVRVMSDACNRAEAEASGAEFVPWRQAPSRPDKTQASEVLRDWEGATPLDSFWRLLEAIMCGPTAAYAADAMAELSRRPADAVVTSEMLLGVLMAAEATRTPLAVLTTNISLLPVPGIPPFGPGFLPARDDEERALHAAVAEEVRTNYDRYLPVINGARERLGLAPLHTVFEQFDAARRILLGTSAAFDFPAEALPPTMRYVGPFLDDPQWVDPWKSPWPADAQEPLVLVAFSTTYQAHEATVQQTLDALGELPVRGLVTLGPALENGTFRAPKNVALRGSAPHSAVLSEAAVAVTHCGHGTVIRALAQGVPLLCLPMGRDQNDNAQRVVARGAGLELSRDASSAEIRAALERLLREPEFRKNAAALGRAIVADATASPVVQEIEGVARRSRPDVRGGIAA